MPCLLPFTSSGNGKHSTTRPPAYLLALVLGFVVDWVTWYNTCLEEVHNGQNCRWRNLGRLNVRRPCVHVICFFLLKKNKWLKKNPFRFVNWWQTNITTTGCSLPPNKLVIPFFPLYSLSASVCLCVHTFIAALLIASRLWLRHWQSLLSSTCRRHFSYLHPLVFTREKKITVWPICLFFFSLLVLRSPGPKCSRRRASYKKSADLWALEWLAIIESR